MQKNIVIIVKNRHMTQKHANTQKSLRQGITVNDPNQNARASVQEVIVIDGPACRNPSRNLTAAVQWNGV